MTDYEAIRNRIVERRTEILESIGAIDKQLHRQLEKDFEEQATDTERDDVLDRLEDSQRAELKQIDKALERLETGDYGVCARCEKPIGAERLEALPYAVHCVRCAEHLEFQGAT